MSAEVLEQPVPQTAGDGEVSHLVCDCDPDKSVCGLDMTGEPWMADGSSATWCPLCCAGVEDEPCPKCGAW